MTTSSDTVGAINEAEIADFLRANPSFLIDRPDILSALEVKHASGDAVSLIERQLTNLRAENERLKARFQELLGVAETNQRLITRIHQLALSLMEATGPEAIFATLNEKLAQDFAADDVRVIVFGEPIDDRAPSPREFVGREAADCGRDLFEALLDSRTPHCGNLESTLARFLLDTEEFSGSAVLLPLVGNEWDGVLMISSFERDRFHENMGTDFLAYLADIATLVIDPWVVRPSR